MNNPNMHSNISLYLAGQIFEAWSNAGVQRSFNVVAGSFSLDIGISGTDATSITLFSKIQPFTECVLCLENEPVITGYIDEVHISYSASSHTIIVSGRDKTADLVDCCALHSPSEWHNVSVAYIANTLCKPFGIQATVAVPTAHIERFRLEHGETAFEALDRLCRMQGLIATSDVSGNLILTKKATVRASVTLQYGKNILSARYSYSGKELFSKYQMQVHAKSWEDEAMQVSIAGGVTKGAISFADSSNQRNAGGIERGERPLVPRYRPYMFIAEDIPTKATALERIELERNNRIAQSKSVNITVQGWREHAQGTLWLPNKIVHVQDDMLGIDEDFFIAGVDYSYGSGGSITQLTLEAGQYEEERL